MTTNAPLVAATPDEIAHMRMCTLRSALRLEILGLRRSHSPSAYTIIKRDFNLHGTRPRVLAQLTALIAANRSH